MSTGRPLPPEPGQAARRGDEPVATPRQAATVVLLRGGDAELEVLLVRRSPEQRFMGGVWVFPGGAVDADELGADAHRVAGVRELEEEAAVRIADPADLVPWSRWITPAQVKIRFDTWFFLAEAPEGAEPQVDGSECVDWRWIAPDAALAAHGAGELELVFPTIKTLEQLARFPSARAAVEHARGSDVQPVEPRIREQGGQVAVLLPGDPGYDD